MPSVGTAWLVWEEGHWFYLRPVIERSMPEKYQLSPVISHIQTMLIIAKSEESFFTSHQSERVDYLWVTQWVESKKEGAPEFNMVCTTSAGFVGHLTKIRRLLSLGWSYLSRKNMHIFFILDCLSEPGGSRSIQHSWACAMVHPCLLSSVSFVL